MTKKALYHGHLNYSAIVTEQRILMLFRQATQGPGEDAITLRLHPGEVNALSGSQEASALVVFFCVLDHVMLRLVDQLDRRVAASVRRQGDHRFGARRPALDEDAANLVPEHQ